MTLLQWVEKNRSLIDLTAKRYGAPRCWDDEERADWVLNQEWLYNAALKDGVVV